VYKRRNGWFFRKFSDIQAYKQGVESGILVFGVLMHYLLFYDVAPDYLTRRAEFRAEHLALAWQANERGELILGGALSDPVDGAVLLFQGETPDVVEKFVAADPYVRNGLVTHWRVRPWTTVVGTMAFSPVRLDSR
jgi:uncharacterized protein